MSRGKKWLLGVAVALVGVVALAAVLLMGPLSPSRRLAAYISQRTGQPCHIDAVYPASGGLGIRGFSLGAEGGPRVEVDRMLAAGELSAQRLDSIKIDRGNVRVTLDGATATLTNVTLESKNLGAFYGRGAGGPANIALSGDAVQLDPILEKRGARFTRGDFTLSCQVSDAPRGDARFPLTVVLRNVVVEVPKQKARAECGEATATVYVTGDNGRYKIDASELAPFLGGLDLSRP